MQCERAQEQLFDYLDHSLTPAMQQVLEHHLSKCDPCTAQFNELRNMYALLDEGLPEVAVPVGFRASVLSAISEQPKPLSLAGRIQQIFLPQSGSRMPAFGFGAVALLVVAAAGSVVVNHHSNGNGNAVVAAPQIQGNMIPTPHPGLSVQNDEIVQSVHNYEQNGQSYHVFGMHLGSKDSQTIVSSYVIQGAAELTTPSLLEDPTLSTAVPSLTLTPGSSYDLPIAVPSNIAAGKTMTLLSSWNDGSEDHQEVCFVPLSNSAVTSGVTVSEGETLFDALATVSAAFNTNIIVNDKASGDLAKPISRGLDMSDVTINDALADLVLPAHHTFTRQNDGSFVIR